jgi:DNA (cytosine-5)-methyltransferase 1
MTRPRLLDLFCGAGGAARGYQQAGFYVVGVDINPQPRYVGDDFIRYDALDYLSGPSGEVLDWSAFAVIHASPPCQDHSMMRNRAGLHGTGWLLEATLERLRKTDVLWIVENVVGSGLATQPGLFGEHGVMLCGASFGLGTDELDLNRHRLFQSNVPLFAPPCSHRTGKTIGVYGHGTNSWHRELLGRNITIAEQRQAMGIDWCTREELAQAIPPAYTKFLGSQLLAALAATEVSPQ